MTPHVRLLVSSKVGRSFGRSVCHNILKEGGRGLYIYTILLWFLNSNLVNHDNKDEAGEDDGDEDVDVGPRAEHVEQPAFRHLKVNYITKIMI